VSLAVEEELGQSVSAITELGIAYIAVVSVLLNVKVKVFILFAAEHFTAETLHSISTSIFSS